MGGKVAQSTEKRACLVYRWSWLSASDCDRNFKYQSKIQWYISLGQDATASQAEFAAILDYVTNT